jgi:hypothetical protein
MELLDKAQDIARTRPLLKNAEDEISKLRDSAGGAERELIGQLFEAMIVARSLGL